MDADRFDTLTRSLSGARSRRSALVTLLGGTLGLLGLADSVARKGKGKKKKKKKKPVFNAFGCLDVGQPCRGNSANCCSGICEGKKPKKGKKDTSTCVAHNTGVCSADTDTCSLGTYIRCNPSNPSCICTLTTGNAGFCAAGSTDAALHCRVCSKDTDCQAEFGAGAACVVLGGACTASCVATGRTACALPCA